MTVIYGLIDPRTSECRYVGKTSRLKQRTQDHSTIKDRTPRYVWISDLRAAGLMPEPVILEELPDGAAWQEYEQFWISYMRCLGSNLLNMTLGGIGTLGHKQSEDTKTKMSHSRMGHVGYMTGKTHSEAAKEKIRKGNIGRTSPMKGVAHSDETKLKMSAAHKGRVKSVTECANIRASKLGKKFNKETGKYEMPKK